MFDGVAGQRGGDVDREQHGRRGAEAGLAVEPERDEQHVAGDPLHGPRQELRERRPGAELRAAEDLEADAHLDHRSARLRGRLLEAREARGLPAPQQRGQRQHEREQHHRQDRGDHSALSWP